MALAARCAARAGVREIKQKSHLCNAINTPCNTPLFWIDTKRKTPHRAVGVALCGAQMSFGTLKQKAAPGK